ncbi:MAG: hypothetical protein F4X59_17105 [Holophagales bacterium]|nr:hypothetical protein [Holophagales bacterium]MYC11825.1 hypothetical protein [Holophagales bacterium]
MKKTASALGVAVLCGLPATAQTPPQPPPIPETTAGLLEYRPTAWSLSAADDGQKRTGRQKAGTWLLLIGTGAMLYGYLEDSDPNCPPALTLSPGSTCYRGGNDELIIGGGALAATGLILAIRGSKGQSQGLSLQPAGVDRRGAPTGLSVSYSIRFGGQRAKTR